LTSEEVLENEQSWSVYGTVLTDRCRTVKLHKTSLRLADSIREKKTVEQGVLFIVFAVYLVVLSVVEVV
jgi:hypothetical protein